MPLRGEGRGEGEESGNPDKSFTPFPFIPAWEGEILLFKALSSLIFDSFFLMIIFSYVSG